MSTKYNLVYDAKLTLALPPAADAAGRSGAWVDTWMAEKLYIVVDIAQGNAAPVTLSFQQATDVNGTGAKSPSGNASIWANQNQAAGDALVQQASAAIGNKKIVFEIYPATFLDVNNAFKTLQVITSASNAANVTVANYFATPLRFAQQIPPSDLI